MEKILTKQDVIRLSASSGKIEKREEVNQRRKGDVKIWERGCKNVERKECWWVKKHSFPKQI